MRGLSEAKKTAKKIADLAWGGVAAFFASGSRRNPRQIHASIVFGDALPEVVLWVVLTAMLAVGLSTMRDIQAFFPQASLRYDEPVSGRAAYLSRMQAAGGADEAAGADETAWPTFWTQGEKRFESAFSELDAICIEYSGDGALAWAAEFSAGFWPGALDYAGCVVSEAFCWQLWGSTRAVGMELVLDETIYTVQGVIKGKTPVALIQKDARYPDDGWKVVELTFAGASDRTAAAEAYAAENGFGSPEAVVLGSDLYAICGICVASPLLLLFAVCVCRAVSVLGRKSAFAKHAFLFLAALLFAFCLPGILSHLPDYALPDKWSDFSHWAALWSAFSDRARAYLASGLYAKDVEGLMLLPRQVLLGAAAMVCSLLLSVRLAAGTVRE
jgi:hypothetical protein